MTSGALAAPAGTWELVSPRRGGTVTVLVALPDGRMVAGASMGVHVSADDGATWRPWQPKSTLPTVASLALVEGRLHVGCAAGLFRDGGPDAGWVPLLLGPVASVAGAGGGVLLAATPTDGVLHSHDGGASWQAANAGLRSLTMRGLAVSEAGASPVALAATADGVYRSTGRFQAWRRVLPTSVDIVDLAVAPMADAVVCLALDATGVLHRSTDAGETWSDDERRQALTTIGVGANPGERLCAAAGRVLLESADGGRTWRTLGIVDEEVLAVCPIPGGRGVVAGLMYRGVVRVIPGRGADRPAVDGRLVAHARLLPERGLLGRPMVITAGIDDGIAISPDGGRSWLDDASRADSAVVAFDARPRSGRVVVAGDNGSLHDGPAGGRLAVRGSTENGRVLALSAEDRIDGSVALVTDNGTVRYTAGDGNWQEVMRASGDAEILGVLVTGDRGGDLVVATRMRAEGKQWGIAWASRDGGGTWRPALEVWEPSGGPVLLDADPARIVVAWGRTLTGVPWPDGLGVAPGPTPLALNGEYTITAVACQPSDGSTRALVGTTAGLASVLIDNLRTTVLEVDVMAPGPAIAVGAETSGPGQDPGAWLVDAHGQVWHRWAGAQETTEARAGRAERRETETA